MKTHLSRVTKTHLDAFVKRHVGPLSLNSRLETNKEEEKAQAHLGRDTKTHLSRVSLTWTRV